MGSCGGGICGSLFGHPQQGLDFGQVGLEIERRPQMRLSLAILFLEKQQHPEIRLGVEVFRV